MSWDIVLFNSRQNISSPEEVDENQLEPTDFCTVFENHFKQIVIDGNHRTIKNNDYVIDYFIDNERVSNKLVSLYGEHGLYELIELARKYNWQIFDTGIGEMIDLDNPQTNGYNNFQKYLKQVCKS